MPARVAMLMCSERSGSNLITRMMGAHPDVCSPAPSHLIRILAENRCRYGDLQVDSHWDRLLNDALKRIANGTYGICAKCGDDISPERLDAVPYAVTCRKCMG